MSALSSEERIRIYSIAVDSMRVQRSPLVGICRHLIIHLAREHSIISNITMLRDILPEFKIVEAELNPKQDVYWFPLTTDYIDHRMAALNKMITLTTQSR